jgi:uncharacterized Zn-binding protein involved in type VI secretion
MSNEVVTVGCKSSHNGVVITGDSTFRYCGIDTACIGHLHSCPEHGITDIVETPQSQVVINGQLVAVTGAKAGCGAVIEGGPCGQLFI